jgi:hypothetical protein
MASGNDDKQSKMMEEPALENLSEGYPNYILLEI